MPKTVKFSTTDLLHSIRQIPSSSITMIEKHVLTILLSCLNTDNETWYSIEAMAEFASASVSTMNRYIKKIEQKGFIKVSRPAHYTHRITNQYCLNIELIMTYHVTKSHVSETTDIAISPIPQTSDMEVAIPTAMRSHVPQLCDRMSHRHTKKDIKKEIKKDREQEGDQEPLSVFFEPDEQNQKLAIKWGLSLKDECESFIHKHKGEKNQWEFERWLKKGHEYLLRQKGRVNQQRQEEPQRQRSTVMPMPVIIRTPESDAIRNEAMANMRKAIGRMVIGK